MKTEAQIVAVSFQILVSPVGVEGGEGDARSRCLLGR